MFRSAKIALLQGRDERDSGLHPQYVFRMLLAYVEVIKLMNQPYSLSFGSLPGPVVPGFLSVVSAGSYPQNFSRRSYLSCGNYSDTCAG